MMHFSSLQSDVELLPAFPASYWTCPPEPPLPGIPQALNLSVSKYKLLTFPPSLFLLLCSLFLLLSHQPVKYPNQNQGSLLDLLISRINQLSLCLPFLHNCGSVSIICLFKILLPGLHLPTHPLTQTSLQLPK